MKTYLFWEDSYKTSCEATVTAIDGMTIQIDTTVFYGFKGGQASDSGLIGGIKVSDAVWDA